MINEERSIWKYILFTILTCGIYGYYFIYTIAQDVNEMCQEDGKQTGGLAKFIVLSILTCGIYSLFWYYNLGNRLQENAHRYGLVFSENGTSVLLWEIFGLLICGIGPFVATNIIIKNTNAMAYAYNRLGEQTYRTSEKSQESPNQNYENTVAEPVEKKTSEEYILSGSCFCSRCGAPMEQSANFCTECGAPNVYMQNSDTTIEPEVGERSIREVPTTPQIAQESIDQAEPRLDQVQKNQPEQPFEKNMTVVQSVPTDAYSSAPTSVLRRQPQATLYVVSAGHTVLISQDAFRLGKNAAAVDYQILNNITVSRLHAIIFRRNGSFFIVDQNSKNGTYVNNVRIMSECELHDGDSIRLSDEEIVFHIRKLVE